MSLVKVMVAFCAVFQTLGTSTATIKLEVWVWLVPMVTFRVMGKMLPPFTLAGMTTLSMEMEQAAMSSNSTPPMIFQITPAERLRLPDGLCCTGWLCISSLFEGCIDRCSNCSQG